MITNIFIALSIGFGLITLVFLFLIVMTRDKKYYDYLEETDIQWISDYSDALKNLR